MAGTDELVHRALRHLSDVHEDPEKKFDVALLERVRRERFASISDVDRTSMVTLAVKILQNVEQDPSPATQLAADLVHPYSFSDILKLDSSIDLVAGLKAPSPPIQLLVLQILSLAAKNLGDVGIVAANPGLVAAMIELWLRSANTLVAESARRIITSLTLAETKDLESASTGATTILESTQQGLMERRVFKDKNVYDLLFSLPSLRTEGQPGQLSKRDKSLAQGRLLDLLKDCWSLPAIWTSQLPEVETAYGLKPGEGLLHFVANHMVDKTDVLVRATQIDFFSALIESITVKETAQVTSVQLFQFLSTTEVHNEILSIYTNPEVQDSLDITFHYAPAARYVAAFAQGYYREFMSDMTTRQKIFHRLRRVLDAVPNSQWARNDGPAHDLHVLVSIPRTALVSDPSLILVLPTIPASADVFRTLAHIFSGRLLADVEKGTGGEVITFPSEPEQEAKIAPPWKHAEQWAARHLFLRYLNRHPNFWTNIVSASNVTAFRDTAVAAISLLHAIVQAQWQTEPGSQQFGIDTSALTRNDAEFGWFGSQPPANGIAAVVHPQVADVLLPFILKRSASGGVGLLGSDTESAAYHVQRAKTRLTAAIETGIKDATTRLGDGDEKDMLIELAAGLGALRQHTDRRDEAGAEVGTMEL